MSMPTRRSADRRMRIRPALAALTLIAATTLGVTAAPADATSSPSVAERAQSAKSKPARDISFGEKSMKVARQYKGVPYRAGGTTPRGFDCSGFTRHVYAELDKRIPRTSQQQYQGARKVDKKNVRVGDLVFFYSGSPGNVYHVAIHAGDGTIWHSPRSGETVHRAEIWTRSWVAGRY